MLKLIFLPLFTLLFLSQPNDPATEIDAFWGEMSRTVAEGEFEEYAALYHEDAVLVNGISGESYPITDALGGWKQGFMDTKAGKMSASVEFRFSTRLHNETTAHDTGIFHYTSQINGEDPQPIFVHFQGLLVKKDGEWKLVMEYQESMASEEEWNELK
ncbi:nuclear transport factor 2 family protein [Gracilimonas sp.]|uniref:YybH family protein n=1 Tax=Gracilimonas sp. TaxID=1974203 RepID=UPI0032EBA866